MGWNYVGGARCLMNYGGGLWPYSVDLKYLMSMYTPMGRVIMKVRWLGCGYPAQQQCDRDLWFRR